MKLIYLLLFLILFLSSASCSTAVDSQERRYYHNRIRALEEQNRNNSFIYLVQLKNGSILPVEIQRIESKYGSYIGPSGEFYRDIPTREQINLLYYK